MRLYQPTYKDKRTSEKKKQRVWWVRFTVKGVRRDKSTRQRNRQAAHRAASDIVKDAELASAGIQTFGDSARLEVYQLIDEHRRELERRGRSPKHIAQTGRTLERLFTAMSARGLGDVTAPRIEAALADYGAGASARTQNYARGALSGFFAWLEKTGRWGDNPVKRVARVREVEKAKRRRALYPAELARLLIATRERPVADERRARERKGWRADVPDDQAERLRARGAERALVYLTAATTGLRRGELGGLAPGDVDLDAATVTVRAELAKNGREATLPLPAGTVAVWRAWLADHPENERALPAVPNVRTLYADLKAAGIESETADGEVDFHALRATYITSLARAGVSLAQAQKLARHSTPTLTANHYVKLELLDGQAAVAKLGDLLGQGDREAPGASSTTIATECGPSPLPTPSTPPKTDAKRLRATPQTPETSAPRERQTPGAQGVVGGTAPRTRTPNLLIWNQPEAASQPISPQGTYDTDAPATYPHTYPHDAADDPLALAQALLGAARAGAPGADERALAEAARVLLGRAVAPPEPLRLRRAEDAGT